jgi:formylmethanofuran dehydrogenase subunit C
MSGLTFRNKAEPEQRLDLSILTPARLAGLTTAEIAALPVGTTRRLVAVGDVFDVDGSDPATIRFEGGSDRFDRIGEALDGGEIHVEGGVGWRVGRLMQAGRLTVSGSVEGLAGSGMSGGFLSIGGNAGQRLGGPMAGEMAGMRGGAIRVAGSAGSRAGDRMRRGTIVVAGELGEDAGSRMIAGTLIAGSIARGAPGRLMKRGTLILCGGAERLGPTFLDNGPADLLILRVMARELRGGDLGELPLDGAPMRRIGGDTAVLGKGEIFLPL